MLEIIVNAQDCNKVPCVVQAEEDSHRPNAHYLSLTDASYASNFTHLHMFQDRIVE